MRYWLRDGVPTGEVHFDGTAAVYSRKGIYERNSIRPVLTIDLS